MMGAQLGRRAPSNLTPPRLASQLLAAASVMTPSLSPSPGPPQPAPCSCCLRLRACSRWPLAWAGHCGRGAEGVAGAGPWSGFKLLAGALAGGAAVCPR
eukprot:1858084-Rhodomonas_salina.3